MIDCTKVVGYIFYGEAYCSECHEKTDKEYKEDMLDRGYSEEDVEEIMREDFEANGGVIFACDEWDSEPSCFTCKEKIDVNLA